MRNTKKISLRASVIFTLLIFVAISLLLPGDIGALGLAVEPAEIVLENVPLGKQCSVSELAGDWMQLAINNKGKSTYSYTVEVRHTTKKDDLKEGYVDVPNTAWIWPGEKEVTVSGGASRKVDLFLKLPQENTHYNKKYQAIIEVKSKKSRPDEIFVLACQIRLCFSTESPKIGQ